MRELGRLAIACTVTADKERRYVVGALSPPAAKEGGERLRKSSQPVPLDRAPLEHPSAPVTLFHKNAS